MPAIAVVLLCMLSMQGCYYMQAVRGQLHVLREREPLDDVIADPDTAPALAERLTLLRDARRYASDELLLPDNDSYRTYADIKRDYVVWNIIAAPEFSLQPNTWCYLFVGCVAYRGYFSAEAAHDEAGKLRQGGFDVFVGGVSAYSTLGRFADPILNTMLRSNDADLVSLLFHELAHQRIYIRDDTEFNESFASAVAEIGLSRWLAERRDPGMLLQWRERQTALSALQDLVDAAVADLTELYGSGLPEAEMRRAKSHRFERLEQDISRLGGAGTGFGGELNNARLASMSLYRGQVEAFLALYEACNNALGCFYRQVETIADLPPVQRATALAAAHPAT